MAALDDLAKLLSDLQRPGLNPELASKLKIGSEAETLARLKTQTNPDKGHIAIHIIAAWVDDCRDAVGDGEVYWWSIPMVGDRSGKIRWDATNGIPTGMPPASVGNKQWLSSLSLKAPPTVAVIAPDEQLAAGIVRVGFYEDDWAKAEIAPALSLGLGALATAEQPAADIESFVKPIRAPIWDSLKAKQDDYMLEFDAKFLSNDNFGAGMVTSHMSQYIRIYMLARDIDRTERCGPFTLQKGQQQRIMFPALEGGGRLAIFGKGVGRADRFGNITIDEPFINTAVDSRDTSALESGFNITAETDLEVVAYYTPPHKRH